MKYTVGLELCARVILLLLMAPSALAETCPISIDYRDIVILDGHTATSKEMQAVREQITSLGAAVAEEYKCALSSKDRPTVVAYNARRDAANSLKDCYNFQLQVFKATGGGAHGVPISCPIVQQPDRAPEAAATSTVRPPRDDRSTRRVALVIGNDHYVHVPSLHNARSDARSVAQTLRNLGFVVTAKEDLPLGAMKAALRDLKKQVNGGDDVVFYFSGHGVQFGGTNYLLPVDIHADSEEQVADESVQLQRVLDDLHEANVQFALAIIDACRTNPFVGSGRAIGTKGLAAVTPATGQMVLFSAGANQEALDSLGPDDHASNGVFTRVLLDEMVKPEVPADQMLKHVRQRVVDLARGARHEQVPALYDQSLGDFYFSNGAGQPAPVPVAAQVDAATPTTAEAGPPPAVKPSDDAVSAFVANGIKLTYILPRGWVQMPLGGGVLLMSPRNAQGVPTGGIMLEVLNLEGSLADTCRHDWERYQAVYSVADPDALTVTGNTCTAATVATDRRTAVRWTVRVGGGVCSGRYCGYTIQTLASDPSASAENVQVFKRFRLAYEVPGWPRE